MRKLLTHEVARLLGLTPDAVRNMHRRGLLRAERVGHVRLFDTREVEALAEQRQARQQSTLAAAETMATRRSPGRR